MKPIKVLILIDRLGRGGIAQVAMNVALTLDRSRFEPILVTTRDKPRNGQDEILRNAGVTLIELDRRSRWQLLSWKPLWQILPSVTILHSHASGSNFWARLWGKLFGVPIVITQEHTISDEKSLAAHYLDRMLHPLSDAIVTVSEFDRERYIEHEKLPPDKVRSIYVGIDAEKFDPPLTQAEARRLIDLPQNKYIIGVIARLSPQKNHVGFFEALTLLPEALRRQVLAVLVGSGDLESELRQQAQRLGLQDQVLFLGERSDVPVILRTLDLFALPSHWECLPSVLSEAMAARCPVVATAVGGVPEIVGDTGWPLVEPGQPAALAQAITEVMQMSPDRRERMADAGRLRIINHFGKNQSVAQIEALYESLLAQLPQQNAPTAVQKLNSSER